MRMITHRKTTLALAAGALMAVSVVAAAPASAQGADVANGGDPIQNNIDARFHNNMHGYVATTTVYATPAYVPVPAPATSYTTVSPSGVTTTTTYMGPSVAYVPAPAYSTTTVIAPRPCNPFDVPRAGVTTACPY
jgi:hypothetical protein